jgi:SAM-dependent methyltransferase
MLITLAALCIFVVTPSPALSQQYEPTVGQEGKDVIWVPTPDELVEAMLDLAKVTPNDYVIDLGSGDGRIVIAAAKRGAHAVGYEYNPDMVQLSRQNAEKAGVAGKATFVNADLFTADLSKATVITMYLLPSLNMRLRPTILEQKPGTRVVSHAFTMEDWQYDQTVEKGGRNAYLWIVPAKVEGLWVWQNGPVNTELKLTQTFQTIRGSVKANGKEAAIKNGKLAGNRISFTAGGQEYAGRVMGKTIEGTAKSGGREQKWSAAKKQ